MTKGRIIVLGYIVRGPIGGMAWHHLQYVLGLHRLGFDVYFFVAVHGFRSDLGGRGAGGVGWRRNGRATDDPPMFELRCIGA
jgi:hypothetical protein